MSFLIFLWKVLPNFFFFFDSSSLWLTFDSSFDSILIDDEGSDAFPDASLMVFRCLSTSLKSLFENYISLELFD